ncbi:zinc finger protein 43-like [Trichomycterus rosablanca]|uniref:zinc finger protein 43-like n=1 Tax=Trichomycterus rosablanca TaxID=2290929 RepID=UPI002F35D96F
MYHIATSLAVLYRVLPDEGNTSSKNSSLKEEELNREGAKISEASDESNLLKSGEVLMNTQCLLELFRFCSACLIECSVSVDGHERLFSVTQDCQSCGFHREWKSQPTSAGDPVRTVRDEAEKAVEPGVKDRNKTQSENKDTPANNRPPTEEEPTSQRPTGDKIAGASRESSVLKSSQLLVNTQCLLELFTSCSVCLIECSVNIEGHKRLFSVTQACQSCGYHREWRSQPTSADELMEATRNRNHDAKHRGAASYAKVKNAVRTGLKGSNRVPVVTRISPLVRRGKGKTPKPIKLAGPSANTDVQEPVEKKQRRNSRPKRQEGSVLDKKVKKPVSVDEDLFTALKNHVELKLVVWCTKCNTDASISCLKHRHKKVFGCAQCGDAQKQGLEKLTVHYDDFANFHSHAETEHGAKPIHKLCHKCSKFVLSDPESRGLKEHKCEPQTQHVCPECGKRFLTESGLKSHYSKCHNAVEQPCKYCMTVFSDRPSKLKHEKTHLKEEKPYSCPKCEEKFENRRKRKSHLRSHEIRVKHKCEICRKSFMTIIGMMKHKAMHVGEDLSKYQAKPRIKSKEIPIDMKQTVVDLRSQKKSIREIAKATDMSRSTVASIIRKQIQTGDVMNRKRSGRPKKTTPEDDQIIMSIMTKNPRSSIRQIRLELMGVGREVSTTTIRRKLHSLNHSIESAYLDNMGMGK